MTTCWKVVAGDGVGMVGLEHDRDGEELVLCLASGSLIRVPIADCQQGLLIPGDVVRILKDCLGQVEMIDEDGTLLIAIPHSGAPAVVHFVCRPSYLSQVYEQVV